MRIVVLDGYTENPGDLSWDTFKSLGEFRVYDRTSVDDETEIQQRIENADIVFTNKTPISKETLDICKNVKFINVLATGYNIVDTDAAKRKGIPVSNIPAYGTFAVGQFAIALLLEICHHIGHHNKAVHEGKWTYNSDWCFWDYPLIELDKKTMGIIGFGRIGQTTGKLAKALGMDILAFDSNMTDQGSKIAKYVDLDTLLSQSDVIALHCPLLPDTKEIICKKNINKMKNGVIIINNSRGQLINEKDLFDALNSGKVYAAGIDVVSTEPISSDNILLKAKNCIITPHISWAAKESRQRIMDMSYENVTAFLSGKPVNVVNN